MKTPPKSPQSSPVKRAKRARLMWANEYPSMFGKGAHAIVLHDGKTKAAKMMFPSNGEKVCPVYVLPASEAAHEQRVIEVAKAIHESDQREKFYSARHSWNKSPSWHRENCLRRAKACLASVYSAPAGKGRADK